MLTLFQAICDAQYRIIAWTMNCPGSQNDRTAFKFSGFEKHLLDNLPDGFFIVGDAAYPASDRVLVPYPGTLLSHSQDAYNYYQSQLRMAIEQTFGIMVSGVQRLLREWYSAENTEWCRSLLLGLKPGRKWRHHRVGVTNENEDTRRAEWARAIFLWNGVRGFFTSCRSRCGPRIVAVAESLGR